MSDLDAANARNRLLFAFIRGATVTRTIKVRREQASRSRVAKASEIEVAEHLKEQHSVKTATLFVRASRQKTYAMMF